MVSRRGRDTRGAARGATDETLLGLTRGLSIAGRFQLIELVGVGGMSVVWSATDTETDQTVALKLLPPEVGGDADAQTRLLREAERLAELDHPAIAGLVSAGEAPDCPEGPTVYMAMPLMQGPSLKSLLAERHTLSPEEVADILDPVAAALDHAHTKKVVHRDMKPGNVVFDKPVGEGGRPMVIDFGIAAEVQHTLTATGVVVRSMGEATEGFGTPPYMSPEQVKGRKPKPTMDIWALAVMAYEMLEGCLPFPGPNTQFQILEVEPERLEVEGVTPEVNAALDAAVRAGLAKDPKKRPKTPGAFAAMFRAACAGTMPATQGAAAVSLEARTLKVGAADGPASAKGGADATQRLGGEPAAAPAPSKVKPWMWAVAGAVIAVAVMTEERPDPRAGLPPGIQTGHPVVIDFGQNDGQGEGAPPPAPTRWATQPPPPPIDHKVTTPPAPTHLSPPVPTSAPQPREPAAVVFMGEPEDAKVYCEGCSPATRGYLGRVEDGPFEVPAGKRRFSLVKAGFEKHQLELDLQAGEVREVGFSMQAKAPPSPPTRAPAPTPRADPRGDVRPPAAPVRDPIRFVVRPVGATLAIDGRIVSTSVPAEGVVVELAAGAHTAEAGIPGFPATDTASFTVAGDGKADTAELNVPALVTVPALVPTQVLLNDRPLGLAPFENEAVAPGVYVLSFVMGSGFQQQRENYIVHLEPGRVWSPLLFGTRAQARQLGQYAGPGGITLAPGAIDVAAVLREVGVAPPQASGAPVAAPTAATSAAPHPPVAHLEVERMNPNFHVKEVSLLAMTRSGKVTLAARFLGREDGSRRYSFDLPDDLVQPLQLNIQVAPAPSAIVLGGVGIASLAWTCGGQPDPDGYDWYVELTHAQDYNSDGECWNG